MVTLGPVMVQSCSATIYFCEIIARAKTAKTANARARMEKQQTPHIRFLLMRVFYVFVSYQSWIIKIYYNIK